jgi:transposase
VCVRGGKGRRHDFRLFRESGVRFGRTVKEVLADSGYQGMQKLFKSVLLPKKGSKKKPLDKESKAHNHKHASRRIKVEHAIRMIKVFRIFRETYRNRRKRFFLRMNLAAAIINLNITH